MASWLLEDPPTGTVPRPLRPIASPTDPPTSRSAPRPDQELHVRSILLNQLDLSLTPCDSRRGPWFSTQLTLSVSVGLLSFIVFCCARRVERWKVLYSPRTLLKGESQSLGREVRSCVGDDEFRDSNELRRMWSGQSRLRGSTGGAR